MPPKKNANKGDDKTFGLKNKNKSSKVQKYVEQVNRQQAEGGKSKADMAKAKQAEDRKMAKDAAEQRKKAEAQLMGASIQPQKVPFGTDPKTILCAYFKAGICQKGSKCKFSHDPNVGRKAEKMNLYEDAREADEKTADTMDNWDEAKLSEVVAQNGRKQKTTTDIVCKHFLQAIEDKKYGWFWICPNGGDTCMYRHALPPGFVLKKDKKDDEKDTISLEDFIEVERHKLKPPLTPVTPETFAAWKKNRLAKKEAEEEAVSKAKIQQRAAGKLTGMTGKDLFDFGGEIFEDEDEDAQEEEWDISRMLARYRDEAENGDGEDVDGVTEGVGKVTVKE
ncbi:hypothetical protein CcaverHIS002_0403910 [Cutaneotrichosporon cavernicola]|uniref:C3H1-type domain-containing protein n=1 Tax=Cutaneotrichosporon cavernicola TaxID=279322 RepID=A0AA48L408_9TREE|nr:uncharacterized protein CcaverHIS019_0403860 [Cutaneotrichosporon cavernicola]BEI83787.1 hypothetical protein CcaverHIS002_0403910 [Cutaneotrichosporon cavernicola]BEI91566.1 hypothetical protein CcaverHIS019_0403860 [Cutaneotrichosporon cavernicola]BEI99343.1 hypothetical protein CcaverHIS631_0403860 [Cutaneotrichosporon cavernicola]BEJ07118.1 hypothetical protein CcaverHIS641_0403870 [Cutaneotrichosporon cavernicola]